MAFPCAEVNIANCTVWAWGADFEEHDTPVQVQNLNGVKSISAGIGHSLALKNDGTVWAWGRNSFGQLGDGTTFERHTPVQVQNLSGVTAIATGNAHSLARKSDGTLWTCGLNDNGQLGDGTTAIRLTPVQVQNLSGVTAMDGGMDHSLALKSDGTVWAWGRNIFGQLGDGTTFERHTPVQVVSGDCSLSGVTVIAAGSYFSLALKTDGTVRAWGLNNVGQLGDGTTAIRLTPVQVQNLSGVTAIAAGFAHSLALRTNGIVQAWGYNTLASWATIERDTPVAVGNLSGGMAIAAGSNFSLAVRTSGALLTVNKILVHPDQNHLRLFDLRVDGVAVRANINGGSTGPLTVSPVNHTVSENTHLGSFGEVISGDYAADGTVNLAIGDHKICTITNYDNSGGCPTGSGCCEPGDGTQGCLECGPCGN